MAPKSREEAMRDAELKEFFDDRDVMQELKETKKIEQLNVEQLAAVVLIGGHGCLHDFPKSDALTKLCSHVSWTVLP